MVWTTTVSIISFNSLSRRKLVNETVSEDFDVRPTTSRIWPIDPNNISTLNADSNLIPQTRLIEFVRVPFGAERVLLLNTEVGPIDSDLAGLATIIPEAVHPSDLQ
jgi:hypothetical protein